MFVDTRMDGLYTPVNSPVSSPINDATECPMVVDFELIARYKGEVLQFIEDWTTEYIVIQWDHPLGRSLKTIPREELCRSADEFLTNIYDDKFMLGYWNEALDRFCADYKSKFLSGGGNYNGPPPPPFPRRVALAFIREAVFEHLSDCYLLSGEDLSVI